MINKKKPYNPLFEPIPGNDLNLHTGLESDDVLTGKTSEKIHKEVFGDLSDKNLMEDIFGTTPRKRYEDITLKDRKERSQKRRKPVWDK